MAFVITLKTNLASYLHLSGPHRDTIPILSLAFYAIPIFQQVEISFLWNVRMADHEKRRKQGVAYNIPTSLGSTQRLLTWCIAERVGCCIWENKDIGMWYATPGFLPFSWSDIFTLIQGKNTMKCTGHHQECKYTYIHFRVFECASAKV